MSTSDLKIAVNIQPVLHSRKSGIGYYADNILSRLVKSCSSDHFVLNYFDFCGKKHKEAERYNANNAVCEPCVWASATLYNLLWAFLPVPYPWFFKSCPDVSLFFNYYLPPFVKGKKVLVVYDMVIKDFPETMSFKTRTMLALTLKRSILRADRIITISDFSKSRIIEHFNIPADKIAVVPCGLDKNRFYPVSSRLLIDSVCKKYHINGLYYLYLGNLEPRKNIARLIEAYSKALNACPDIPKLVLAGAKGWGYKDIFESVCRYKLSDKVIFTGYVDQDDVLYLLNGATAFCFPSLYEGFGMPPLEAMACGVPAIVSRTSSLPEVMGNCGISVDPYNVDEISEALIHILSEPFCAQQRELGIARAAHFSWDRSVETLKGVLEELVNE